MALSLVAYVKHRMKGELPDSVIHKMYMNCIIDFIIGLVPFVGDLADTVFKANTRNVREFEKFLDQKYKPHNDENYKQRQSFIGGRAHPPPPATVYEDFSDDETDRRDVIREHNAADGFQRPTQAQPEQQQPVRGQGFGGWFSGARRGDRQPDLERGTMRQTAPAQSSRPVGPMEQETGTVYSGR